MKQVNTTYWKVFRVGELFPNIYKPAVYHSREVIEDALGIPYVVRSKFNNGIKCRVNKDGIKINPRGVISFGAENAAFFYQNEEWCSGRDIYYVDTRDLSYYACAFLNACLNSIAQKYTYNNGLFPDLLKKEKIKLPSTPDGSPDWQYMEEYMRKIEQRTQTAIPAFLASKSKPRKIDTNYWKEFHIDELFDVVKGKRLTKADMIEGRTNYIGATAFNNGITAKIGNSEYLHPAGTITVCYNGSIGQTFYQEEPFWATDDVNVLYPKFMISKHVALFICPIIYKVSLNYAYVDKWTAEKMRSSKIKLPSTSDGSPDWRYMERYMRGVEAIAKEKIALLTKKKQEPVQQTNLVNYGTVNIYEK